MAVSRLSLALEDCGADFGAVGVLRPTQTEDLGALPKASVQIEQGVRPDFEHWRALGYDVQPEIAGPFTTTLLCLPRAKPLAQDLLARAMSMTPGGTILVDGARTDGIDSLFKLCRARVPILGTVTKAHGRAFWIKAGPEFDDLRAAPTTFDGFTTTAGVFSADGPDPGSVMLAQALPDQLPAEIADLGAGWGYLGRQALARSGVKTLHLVEADHAALACARQNLPDPRAQFHWADATRWQPPAPLGGVIMNPPFHTGRKGDPQLGQAFIRAAAAALAPSGKLWMVANRHLPYESHLQELFRTVEEIGGDTRFKLIAAALPRRQTKRTAP